MKKMFIGALIASSLFACNNEEKKEDASTVTKDTSATQKSTAKVELLGDELNAGDQASWDAFSKGDIDGFTANFDENVRMNFSGGDSLVGKKAIVDYYKGRWKLIDAIKFSNPIILPVKSNEMPGNIPTGKWMLSWHQVDVKYKNGKNITFWTHNANHYNEAGKVDYLTQYIDFHPIKEATKDMMK
ncbi:MAG: nuclear transport factor 2 family protein [Ferruginibacter sp.]|nr:nuclear transport factor 2 family protein [Ferruginibacter sp.]